MINPNPRAIIMELDKKLGEEMNKDGFFYNKSPHDLVQMGKIVAVGSECDWLRVGDMGFYKLPTAHEVVFEGASYVIVGALDVLGSIREKDGEKV